MGNLTGREQSVIYQHAQTKGWSIRQVIQLFGVKLVIVRSSLSLQTNWKKKPQTNQNPTPENTPKTSSEKVGHGGKCWAMFSLQRFIFIVPLRNTGDCTEFGAEEITNFIKNKIEFQAADVSTAANFPDKTAGHLLTHMVWVTFY